MKQIRQLAAILFSDISGYSSLMSQNEDHALEITRINRDIQKQLIEQYRGTWLKEMGDGVLAKFTTANDSVQCALAIQHKVREKRLFKVRIGIHLGDISMENGDVFGDGVNVASRIESLADPGGIYISESVYKAILARHEVEVKDLGELTLKHIPYPIRIYALKGEGLPFPHPNISKHSNKKSRIVGLGILFFIVLLGSIYFFQNGFQSDSQSDLPSIAVMPFDNLSNDPDMNLLLEGLHDAIIGKLSRIQDVRVISRTSTLRFKDTKLPISEIAKQLNVDNVLESSVLPQKERLVVQVQLIEAYPQESHLWSQEYQKSQDELLSIQSDVALSIASELGLDATNVSGNPSNVDPEIYKLYLRGMHALEKGTEEDMMAGMDYLDQAVELDPTSAFAYSGLAQGYVILGHSRISKPEHFIKAKAAATQAIELDPQNASAFSALADVKMYYERDFEGARNDFQKAVELRPNLEVAHAHYAWLHAIYEDWEQAIYHARLTTELDPFSAIYSGWLAWMHWFAGSLEEAIEWGNKTIEINPNFSASYYILGKVYAEQGLIDKAKDHFTKLDQFTPGGLDNMVQVYASMGDFISAELLYQACDNPNRKNLIRAVISFYEGNPSEIFDLMESQPPDRAAPWFHCTPNSDPLHGYPRFIQVCRRNNIPEEVLMACEKCQKNIMETTIL